jgi:hypothetical protein
MQILFPCFIAVIPLYAGGVGLLDAMVLLFLNLSRSDLQLMVSFSSSGFSKRAPILSRLQDLFFFFDTPNKDPAEAAKRQVQIIFGWNTQRVY